MKVIINKTVRGDYAVTVRSARFPSVVERQTGIASLTEARASVDGWKAYVAELEVAHLSDLARTRYNDAVKAATALQDAYPSLYLFDECVSFENAVDGLRQGGDITNYGTMNWSEAMYDAMARHIHADTGLRAAELGICLDGTGIRY